VTGRIALGAAGISVAGWGVWTLLTNQRPDQLIAAATWLAGGVVAHDFILAPVVLGAGWLLLRLPPPWVRGPATAGAVILGTATLVALPVLGGWGRRADNPSLLPRDYWSGWVAVATIVAIGVVAAAMVVRSRQRAGR
jgi:hypothetical protein